MASFEQEFGHLRISLVDILQATSNFAAEKNIGSGGFGKVYSGMLLRPEGAVMCAFKRLDRGFGQGDHEFWKESVILSHFKHENIVSLVGFCDETGEKVLVHEFQTYGSLDEHLSMLELTWLERLQICLGAARGLDYLHYPTETRQSVIHHDVKSSNILLDKNRQAKIADLGLSKSSPSNLKHTFLIRNATDTFGYVDPLYIETGFLTKESDVYSFGVVLFEVLCSRLVIIDDDGPARFLNRFACQHYEDGTIANIIDPLLRKQMNPHSMKVFSTIAYQCLKRDRAQRPTIKQIVERLKEALDVQVADHEKALALQQVREAVEVGPSDKDDYFKKNCLEHWKIPFEHIHSATNKFSHSNVIGLGGFGGVYKGELFHFDVKEYLKLNEPHRSSMVERCGYPRRKSKVAVKRLDSRFGQGRKEFLQEIKVLCGLHHVNLVSLLGFCDEKDEMMLVYEYASNGSLDKYIREFQNGDSPTWEKRLQICLDAAHGLNYLHKHDVQHRDIKSANVLLSHNWKAMIADFGLSRFRKHETPDQFSKTSVVGTLFCADPNYVRTGILSNQSDIYSFGVILLEVLFGRQAFLPRFGDDPEYLVHMAERHFRAGEQLIQNIDGHLREELEKGYPNLRDSINTFVSLAYDCLHSTQTHQLTMENVVAELKRAMTILHSIGVEPLSLRAIRNATNDFKEQQDTRMGAFSNIYKAEVTFLSGPKQVAVKRLNVAGSYEEGEFLNRVARLSCYIHENIIPLQGFCEEGNEKILIFEHATNGSLDKHLDNYSTLTWGLRLKISIGAAKGLRYIHTLNEDALHGDIKSSRILLDHEWKATISGFIISKGNFGRIGCTKESDVYSFGVVLVEILLGRLAIEKVGKYLPPTHHKGIHLEPKRNIGEENIDEQVWLAEMVVRCFEDNRLEAMIFEGIKEQTDRESIYMFSKIACDCLRKDRQKRPTMARVLRALKYASEIHEDWELQKLLPTEYEEIIKMSRDPTFSTIMIKNLYSLFCSGMLLERENVWFSMSEDGVVNEVVSAKKFSYKEASYPKWRSNTKSRFSKVAKVSNISNLDIRINIGIQYLTSGMIYGAYLVFMFRDRRKVSNQPIYVNLKYQKGDETLNAYFAEWKTGSNWLMLELFRVSCYMGRIDFDVLLEGFSQYYCGRGDIVIEGIEFQAIAKMDFEYNKEFKDGKNVQRFLESELGMDQREQVAIDYKEIIKRSGNEFEFASKEDIYFILSDGILIDNDEKFLSLSKVNGKICHMVAAKMFLGNSSNIRFCEPPAESRCVFGEVAEILSHQVLSIKCHIETQMLSSDTTYACFLVFKLSENCRGLKCPVKARDLLPNRKERTKIMAFTTPSTVNLDKIKWVPNEREDKWKEVIVWETIFDNKHGDEYIPMDLKLITFEGTMAGLIVYGIEFRPI